MDRNENKQISPCDSVSERVTWNRRKFLAFASPLPPPGEMFFRSFPFRVIRILSASQPAPREIPFAPGSRGNQKEITHTKFRIPNPGRFRAPDPITFAGEGGLIGDNTLIASAAASDPAGAPPAANDSINRLIRIRLTPGAKRIIDVWKTPRKFNRVNIGAG